MSETVREGSSDGDMEVARAVMDEERELNVCPVASDADYSPFKLSPGNETRTHAHTHTLNKHTHAHTHARSMYASTHARMCAQTQTQISHNACMCVHIH